MGVVIVAQVQAQATNTIICSQPHHYYYTHHNQAVATYAQVGASVPAILHTTRTQLTYS